MTNESGGAGRKSPGRDRPGRRDQGRPRGERGRKPERGRGERGDRGRAGARESSASNASYRVVQELSVLEKALTTKDFVKQKAPLEEILKALRPLRLKSIDELDMNTRGRLLTTLLRVSRQPKPAAPGTASGPSPGAPTGSEAADRQEATLPESAEAPTGEEPAPSEIAETAAGQEPAPPESAEAAAGQEPAASESAEAAAGQEPAPSESAEAAVGQEPAPSEIPEAAAGEEPAPSEIAETAAGQKPAPPETVEAAAGEGLSSPAEPTEAVATEPAPEGMAPSKSDAEATHQAAASGASKTLPADDKSAAYSDVMFLVGSIWQAVRDERRAASAFASSGRKAGQDQAIRVPEKSAARLHERQKSNADAARLYEASGDIRNALRAVLQDKNLGEARRLMGQLTPEQSRPILEKAGSYELLMEQYVQARDFDSVARLYERARQFDQAALAWERAGKLPNARKAFERARDPIGADRIRSLEVSQLIKRGDRLGAASLLVSGNKREEAVKILSILPGPRAFEFMQKLKLDAEALSFARSEIAKAEQEKRPATKARWLEQVGETLAAAEAWEHAARRDKALALYEQSGNWEKAARLAEITGQLDKAVEYYHRAGDKDSADRVAALPRPAQPVPAATGDPPPTGSPS